MKTYNQTNNVVITGGSSGIGLETALQFANSGARIFLLARNQQKLEQAKNTILQQYNNAQVEIYPCDVSDKQAVKVVIEEIGNNRGGIHTLINNAGTILCGRLTDNSLDQHESLVNTNYFGMLYALYYAWPFLKNSQDAHIGFVSSVAGYVGAIGYTGYAPSKFAISGLAESIRMEAKESGIGVTIIYPPDTETPFLKYERSNTLVETLELSKTAKVMSPKVVANQFFEGISKNKFEVICNFESKMVRILKVLFPKPFFNGLDKIVKI